MLSFLAKLFGIKSKETVESAPAPVEQAPAKKTATKKPAGTRKPRAKKPE